MRILFLGTPEFAVPSLAALIEAGHDVACVVTQPDRPSGRRRRLAASPAKRFAAERGLALRQSDDVNEEEFLDGLAEMQPELVVVAAFGQKLGVRFLRLPRCGCINVHASLLPRHRGAAPIAHAILAGDSETGVTIMQMAETMDTGDILVQEAVPIGPSETTGELTARLAKLGARLLLDAIGQIAGGWAQAVPHDQAQATRAPAFHKNDGLIDWSRPAAYLDRFVRAMTPWPGAFTFCSPQGKAPLRLVICEAVPDDATPAEAPPGSILAAEGEQLSVQTGDGILHVLRLQPAGKRPMSAADFLRGHSLPTGSLLRGPEQSGA